MKSRSIALWAAAAAAVCWAAKSVAIGVAGGLGRSPLEGPLFFAGLVSFMVTVVAVGIALTPGARTWKRVAAGVAAFLVGFAFSLVVNALVAVLQSSGTDRHWVWSEVNLWVSGFAALAIAVALNRSPRPRTTLA